MKKHLILLAIFSLALTACSGSGESAEELQGNLRRIDTRPVQVTTPNGTAELVVERDAATNSAVRSGRVSDCDSISDSTFKDQCILSVVSSSNFRGSAGTCNSIQNSEIREACEINLSN